MTPAASHKSNHIVVAVAAVTAAATVPLAVAVVLESIRHMPTSAPALPATTRGSCNCCPGLGG